jgi:hypothetical protein
MALDGTDVLGEDPGAAGGAQFADLVFKTGDLIGGRGPGIADNGAIWVVLFQWDHDPVKHMSQNMQLDLCET